jgi:hypothetical protein
MPTGYQNARMQRGADCNADEMTRSRNEPLSLMKTPFVPWIDRLTVGSVRCDRPAEAPGSWFVALTRPTPDWWARVASTDSQTDCLGRAGRV